MFDGRHPYLRPRGGLQSQVGEHRGSRLGRATGPDQAGLCAAQVGGHRRAGRLEGGFGTLAGPVEAGGVPRKPLLRLHPRRAGGRRKRGGGVVIKVQHGAGKRGAFHVEQGGGLGDTGARVGAGERPEQPT